MKTLTVTVHMTVDDENPNAPTLDDLKVAILGAVETPDNKYFGIRDIRLETSDFDKSDIISDTFKFDFNK